MSSPNLGIIHIAASQNQKEVTANAAFDQLDLALTNYILEDIPDSHFILPTADADQNMVFIFAGVLTSSRGVTLPTRRLYIVSNQTFGSPLASLIFGTASSPTGRVAIVPPGLSTDYAILYCDGVNVDIIAGAGSGKAPSVFSVGTFAPGLGSNSQVLLYLKMDRGALFPFGAAGSVAVAKTAPTSNTQFTIRKNGLPIAFVNFAAGVVNGTFSQTDDAIFNPGDVLEIDGPNTADVTLANVGITYQGFRY